MQTIIINTTTVVFNVGIQKSITDPKIQFVTPLEIYKVQKAVSCSTILWKAFNFTHFLRGASEIFPLTNLVFWTNRLDPPPLPGGWDPDNKKKFFDVYFAF